MTWAVDRAEPPDRETIVRLLVASDLPTEDLDGEWHESYLVVRDDEAVAGIVGLEMLGRIGLIRSLATSPTHRRRGVASALLTAAETRAADRGLEMVFALTVTAEAFLSKRGFEAVDRTTVPEGIRTTAEFRELCPETAVCLRKRIA